MIARKIRRRVQRGIEAGKQKYAGSSADVLWKRLNSVQISLSYVITGGEAWWTLAFEATRAPIWPAVS